MVCISGPSIVGCPGGAAGAETGRRQGVRALQSAVVADSHTREDTQMHAHMNVNTYTVISEPDPKLLPAGRADEFRPARFLCDRLSSKTDRLSMVVWLKNRNTSSAPVRDNGNGVQGALRRLIQVHSVYAYDLSAARLALATGLQPGPRV